MNYSQTIEYLFTSLTSYQEVGGAAYKPGLERITAFCRHLGNPQRNFYTIHIAGTNGKGSLSHTLAALLHEAGYCVGLYTSPHLMDFRERVRVDGQMIPKQKVVNFIDKNRAKMEELSLSFFEMSTALAFDFFAQSNVEVAIIETGLGGRLDATNVITPILSIVTNVGLDHQQYLGETIPQIAMEKAGIFKKSIPILISEHNEEYDELFVKRAAELNSPILFAEDEFVCLMQEPTAEGQRFKLLRKSDNYIFDLDLDLAGEYQRHNILGAITAADFLHRCTPLSISRRAFLEGVKRAASSTALKGRWQTLSTEPLTVCDTAHNSHGIKEVTAQLKKCKFQKLYCVLGFANDKDLESILPLFPAEAHYIFTAPNNRRAMAAAELEQIASRYELRGEVVEGVAAALERARELAQSEDMIFVGGSNFVVAEIVE